MLSKYVLNDWRGSERKSFMKKWMDGWVDVWMNRWRGKDWMDKLMNG